MSCHPGHNDHAGHDMHGAASVEHQVAASHGMHEGRHQMDGIPTWMAMGGLVLVIVFSHLLLTRRSGASSKRWRFDILRFRPLRALVGRSWFPMVAQGLSIALFLLVLYAGFFGSTRVNIAPVLTWTWWWILLIFFIVGFGSVFCTVCPWEGISSLLTSGSLNSRKKRIGFNIRWPRSLRNIYPALILFIILTWFELGLEITRSPYMTAVMALAFVTLAVGAALLFERRAFCRYLCLVGRIQGLYALFSPFELRARSNDVCRTCKTQDCYRGNETSVGCPTHLFPGFLKENTYCTLCTECIRACPHDNLGISARPFASDLLSATRFRWDEAIFAVVLLALTSFHGLTMTPHWTRAIDHLRLAWGVGPTPIFTLLMTVMTLLPLALFWFAAGLSRRTARDSAPSQKKIFMGFAYSLIPIALFYHLAHNGMHFFMEAQNIVPVLSDPFGWGWNLFGTAGKTYPALLSLTSIWWLQIALIIVGHLYGVVVADRSARVVFQGAPARQRLRALVPLIAMMVVYSGFSIWLIAQPMDMRTAM
jgi:ferredoxin